MPSGKHIPLENIYDILLDAARNGVSQTAEDHEISAGTIYRWRREWPEDWAAAQEEVQGVVEMDTARTWVLASNRLIKMLEDENQDFKPGELANILRNCTINFKRFREIASMKMTLSEMIQAVREGIAKGHQDTLELLRELGSKLTEEQIAEIERFMSKPDDSEEIREHSP